MPCCYLQHIKASFILFLLGVGVWDNICLWIPSYLGTHYLDHAGLKLTDIFLPLPRSIGIKNMHNHDQLPREGFICLLDLTAVTKTSPLTSDS